MVLLHRNAACRCAFHSCGRSAKPQFERRSSASIPAFSGQQLNPRRAAEPPPRRARLRRGQPPGASGDARRPLRALPRVGWLGPGRVCAAAGGRVRAGGAAAGIRPGKSPRPGPTPPPYSFFCVAVPVQRHGIHPVLSRCDAPALFLFMLLGLCSDPSPAQLRSQSGSCAGIAHFGPMTPVIIACCHSDSVQLSG